MKFIWLCLCACALLSTKSIAQTNPAADTTLRDVFTFVEQMPEFPGGQNAMLTYLRTNIEYPDSARVKQIEGRVYLRFVVDKDGNVVNPEVARSVDPLLDEEAIRVVRQMPKWTPGKQNGKAVNVYFTLPISFSLQQ